MKLFQEMLHRNSDAPTMTKFATLSILINVQFYKLYLHYTWQIYTHPAVNYVETAPVWLKTLCIELSILLTEMAKEWWTYE